MAAPTVADYLLERLRDWGVDKVFAFPGDGINGILAAWGRADNHPQFVQSRHEEMSAFEAVGYAKFTDRFGVCMATSGPGAIHLLNGLYDAKLDHDPVVTIVGQTTRSAMGGSYQQQVDLLSLYKDVASDYVQMVTVPEQLPYGTGSIGLTIDQPGQVGPAWERALAADRPTLLDVHTDPDVPPIPPHATFEQMKNAAAAMLHGDENRWGIVKEGVKTKVQDSSRTRRTELPAARLPWSSAPTPASA